MSISRSLPRIHPASAILRIVAGLGLLGGAVLAGGFARSPLTVASLAAVFTFSFIIGRMTTWNPQAGMPSQRPNLVSLALTFAIQSILVGGLYLLGAGMATVLGNEWSVRSSAAIDVIAPILLGIVCSAMGVWAANIDRAVRISDAGRDIGPHVADWSGKEASEDASAPDEIRVLMQPLTPDTFFEGIHYSHGRSTDGGFDSTPNEASSGSDDKIGMAEARLGIALPEGLRALYRVQNGGSVSRICIAKDGIASPRRYDEILNPFGGYDDLYPTETLMTARESFLGFADPDDHETYGRLFTGGTERMILLAQWYRQSLVLDYSRAGEPRVGFIDFDDEGWMQRAVWWPDFGTFFALLRRYEDA
jgi:hypothetical protein